MLRLALPALVIAALATGCVFVEDDDPDATLAVYNESDYALIDLRLYDGSWTGNLLGGDPLYPGDSIGLAVDCGVYDVQVVDDTGVDCTLANLDLCGNSESWVIDNLTLDVCAFNPYKPAAPKE